MTTASWFVTAAEARNNIIKDITVHGEICDLENAVLQAVKNGDYQTTVSDGTLMTASTPVTPEVFTVNPDNSELIVPNHGLSTGDQVYVSSSQTLPPPLQTNTAYWVIYIDENTIKLAATRDNALAGRPISIMVTQGVTGVNVTNHGSLYLSAPTVTFVGDSTTPAKGVAILEDNGVLASITLETPGSGYTDFVNVQIAAPGSGVQIGTISYKVISATIASGGVNYNIGDIVYLLSGSGAIPFSAQVTTTNGGAITGIQIVNGGDYSVLPSLTDCHTYTNGGGGLATLNLVMGISTIPIVSPGVDYIPPLSISIQGGGGSGATATPNIMAGGIQSITVTNPGSNYTGPPTVTFNTGTDGTAKATLQPTGVQSVVLNYAGDSYTSVPAINFVAQGSGAVAGQVYLKVVQVVLRNPGLKYTVGDNLLVAGGTGPANAIIQVTGINSSGSIQSYNIISNGKYTAVPTLLSNNVFGGTGNSAIFDLQMGLESITVTAGGNYTIAPTVVITGGGGVNAAASAMIDIYGTVTGVQVTNPGTNFTDIPTVSFSTGSGAQGYAVMTPGGDSIDHIVVTSPGSGYTLPPSVTVSEGNASLSAVLQPTGIQSVQIITPGQDYFVDPAVIFVPGGNQQGNPVVAQAKANRGFGVSAVNISSPGDGYTAVPGVQFSAPSIGGTSAQATATIGYGTGNLTLTKYNASQDYFQVWQNCMSSSNPLSRVYADQLAAITAYFTNLGYTITQSVNPLTGNTFVWNIMW
jgi:hypothetical protein